MADSNKKAEKIAAAKKKLKQFQKSGRARSASRTRGESTEREIVKESSPTSKGSETPPEVETSPSVTEAVINGERQSRESVSNRSNEESRHSASTESLHQLSRQINGLLSEERNRDLAALLEQHVQANEQLNTQNQQLREHSQALQKQLESERNLFHEKQKKDIGSLKEQLQVHIQTIGILVAEKTELQSQVNQSQRIAEQRIEEIEELSGRLKASRQRVSDLERSLSSTSQSSQQLEKNAAETAKELDRLKLENFKANKQNEELHQQLAELREQLQAKASESRNSSGEVEELKKKLEMAELYAQQLSSENESSQGSVEVLNSLQKERDSLLARLHQHEELNQKLQLERDQVTEQYQQYTDTLRHQTQQLTQQISVLTEEREQLLTTRHSLENKVESLERKLEDLADQPPPPQAPAPAPAAPSIPQELTNELEKLRADVKTAAEALEAQLRDNVQMSRMLEEREEKVQSLERRLEDLGEQEGDKAQLLESIQSDRTALSRALTQNRELKTQLEELQQAFVKMSTDNMELETRYQTEQHSANELAAKLAQQEDELTQLREQLSEREGEVSQLRMATESVEKEILQQDSMKDRLRHYEAQAQLVNTLQNELTAAQDMMEALTTQNSELRTMLIKATEVRPATSDSGISENGEPASNGRGEVIESLQATIKQLEYERTQLYESLKEQRSLSDSLGIKIADLQEELIRNTSDNVDSEKISRVEYNQLKQAMEMIQDKYMHVMNDKAELSDKADQLEHLVLQLQGETDTIGEYISLYHHQRALLQQRETQKNDYIAQLARDREQLQDKLGELQALVMQLLGERNMLHSYNEESKPQSGPPPVQMRKAQPALSNGALNNYDHDWPDYTSSESDTDSEVEPIVGGQQLTPEASPQPSPPDTPRDDSEHPAHRPELYPEAHHKDHAHHDAESEHVNGEHHPPHHQHHHHHHRHHHHHQGHQAQPTTFVAPPEDDRTAHKILSLLTELGHSHMVEQIPLIDRNFLPCKFCKGAVQIV